MTIDGGGLQIGWNTPLGMWNWGLGLTYTYPNGTSKQGQWLSSGTYTWDGQTLTLVDSRGPMAVSMMAGLLTVDRQGHRYQFLKLIESPPPGTANTCN